MDKLICEDCGITFEVNEEELDKKLRYMECPYCGGISKNPYYQE